MKVLKTVKVPESAYEKVDYIQCELCEEKSGDEDNWDDDQFRETSVEVRCSVGSSYPSGGHKKSVIVDLCPGCFAEKLLPWLRSQGARDRTEEIDW